MSKKICIIGAGSAIFSLNLVRDICINPYFKGSTVALMDIDQARLDAIYSLCTRYAGEMEADIQVEKTTDRKKAMEGADFVLNVALDFGHDRFKQGIKVAYNHGYRFGGSLHAVHDEAFYINFHQLQLMESILKDMLSICPKAYYILVANPVQGGVTYLSRKYPEANIVGMCHGYTGVYTITDMMRWDRKDVGYTVAGVNHFIWLTSFTYKGENAYPHLDKWIEEHEGRIIPKEVDRKSVGLKRDEISLKAIDLYHRFGLFPIGDTASAGGGAWGWEYHTDAVTEAKYESTPYNWYQEYFTDCVENVAEIKRIVEDESICLKDYFSGRASDEPMIPLMEGLAFGTGTHVVVNILNKGGYMKDLPADYEVEIASVVDKDGIHPIPNAGLPKPIMAHLFRDRIASVEIELAAYENHSKAGLVDLILMDPWTKSRKQAEDFIDAVFSLPCNRDMAEYYH